MLELFRRMVLGGGDNLGNPPIVNLVWGAPLSGTDDQVCTKSVCNYLMLANATDADNDIVEYLFQVSTDLGNTWVNRKVGTQADLTDTISSGAKWYRVIVTNSEGLQTISKILKISKSLPGMGDVVLVYNGVHYSDNNEVINAIPMLNTGNISFYFKNKHTTQYVECDTSYTDKSDSVIFHPYGNSNLKISPISTPKKGDVILPGNQVQCIIPGVGNTGLHVINFTQVIGQVGGSNIVGTRVWIVNLSNNVNPITMTMYRAYRYGNSGDDITMTYLDKNGVEQSVTQYAGGGMFNGLLEVFACAITGSANSNGILEEIGPCQE